MDPEETRLRTWTRERGIRTWDLKLDTDWPMDKWSLRLEAETATTLTPTGELKGLSLADWTRKRFCEYDAIRHDLKRLSDAEWAESERRCKALDQPEQPRAPPPTAVPRGMPMDTDTPPLPDAAAPDREGPGVGSGVSTRDQVPGRGEGAAPTGSPIDRPIATTLQFAGRVWRTNRGWFLPPSRRRNQAFRSRIGG
jgi:hypothetical protein